ncbi:hypothetical protein GSI_08667 [Ganoderma sinense ZZ0214-1]|uniref:DUF8212 domain-containing protein n=1 Tax=Ganoderma sinense ZZ0214-1 TaxID=1077348 RepID=A0A2G8S4F5_9APHY|nr:hypothetical protein GSI_08667 [Ganoderma sinense ZZ0214-1]
MYQWYTYAEVCYAYLADVTAKEDAYAIVSTFRCSRWFSRGWTLQELIAPAHVEFLAKDWTPIGSKRSLGTLVSTITNIHYTALLRLEPLSEFSVAQRLSWASRRQTTRVEDRAYSLLGIFDINMPLLYGEGERAFRRLQEEIMRRIPDQSLFSWSWSDSYLSFHSLRGQVERGHDRFRYDPNLCGRANTDAHESLLAPSPDLFRHCGRIEAVPHHEVTRQLQLGLDVPTPSYDFTPHGIRTQLPMIPLSLYLGGIGTQAAQLHSLQIDLKTIHIPYPDRIDAPRVVAFRKTHERFHLILPKKTRRALCAQGYSPSLKGGDAARPTIQWLALLHRDKSHSVLIKFQHTLDSDGVTLSLEAYVRLAGPRGLHERPDLWELVSWTDSYPWAQVLDKRAVAVTADSRTLKVTLELHLVSPDHYVPHVEIPHVEIPHVEIPHVEIHDESDIVQPSSDWPRLLTSIGSQSESIGTSCERRTQTKEYWEKGERVEADHLETRGEGGGSTDGKGAGPSWWAVPCDF